jgi:hypothetical protein
MIIISNNVWPGVDHQPTVTKSNIPIQKNVNLQPENTILGNYRTTTARPGPTSSSQAYDPTLAGKSNSEVPAGGNNQIFMTIGMFSGAILFLLILLVIANCGRNITRKFELFFNNGRRPILRNDDYRKSLKKPAPAIHSPTSDKRMLIPSITGTTAKNSVSNEPKNSPDVVTKYNIDATITTKLFGIFHSSKPKWSTLSRNETQTSVSPPYQFPQKIESLDSVLVLTENDKEQTMVPPPVPDKKDTELDSPTVVHDSIIVDAGYLQEYLISAYQQTKNVWPAKQNDSML